MSQVFVVVNQQGLFANKQKEWTDGRDPKQLFQSQHKDEAINLVFELSSRDIYLRAEAISVKLNDKKHPIVNVTAPLVEPEDSTQDDFQASVIDSLTVIEKPPVEIEQG